MQPSAIPKRHPGASPSRLPGRAALPGTQCHTAAFGSQHRVLDVARLGGREPARAAPRTRGAMVEAADEGTGALQFVVSPELEARDSQDPAAQKERCSTGDGAHGGWLACAQKLGKGFVRSWAPRASSDTTAPSLSWSHACDGRRGDAQIAPPGFGSNASIVV